MRVNSYTSNSRRKKFLWLKLIVFIGILVAILNQIGKYYEEIKNKNVIVSNFERAMDEFFAMPPNSIDMLFIGSSHAYCTFDPEIVDNSLGTTSFNLGSPLQHPDTSYHLLKKALETQNPKTVVFEIYWDMLDDEFELKQADSVLSAIHDNKFKREFIRDVFPLNEKIKYYFKPIRYQQDVFAYWDENLTDSVEKKLYHKELANTNDKPNTDSEQTTTQGVSYHKGRGFIYSDIIIPEVEFNETNQFVGFDGAKWEFDKKQKEYVKKIVELCRENDIEIVFVTAPIANISMEHIKNYHALHEKIASFAEEMDVPYIDYNIVNMEENLLTNENFRDDAHLNYSGVQIIMKHFVKWIKEAASINEAALL